jgi:hypothetical protein
MIQRAGMQPHPAGAERPGIAHRAGQQVLAEPAPELSGHDAEIRDLHRIILGHAPQLVPSRELGLLRAVPACGDEEGDGGIRKVSGDLRVGPVPAIPPMERRPHRLIAQPIQHRLRLGRAHNGNIGKRAEGSLELAAILQLEIGPSDLHIYNMTFNKMGTLPLPLALHLATYTVIGLFCAFAGGLNLIDPVKIIPNAIIFLGLAGFSWGYVFGILMARKEVLGLGLLASLGYVAAGIWQLGPHWPLGALLLAIGVYGLATIALYRRQILEA